MKPKANKLFTAAKVRRLESPCKPAGQGRMNSRLETRLLFQRELVRPDAVEYGLEARMLVESVRL